MCYIPIRDAVATFTVVVYWCKLCTSKPSMMAKTIIVCDDNFITKENNVGVADESAYLWFYQAHHKIQHTLVKTHDH